LAALARALGPLARAGDELGSRTTYRVGGPAAVGVVAESLADLRVVARVVAEDRAAWGCAVPVVVLGRGSNMLVADRGLSGLAVRLGRGFADLKVERPADPSAPDAPTVVRAGGALELPVLARRTVEVGLGGLEWAVGVPGSVGGAVRMNAGGHGSDVAASVVRCAVLDLVAGGTAELGPDELALAYRRSAVSSAQVVLWAEFALAEQDTATGKAAIAQIVRWRRANQPGGSNAGSVFVNPPDDSAGRLIEAAGLKGHRIGTARVSEKHANFVMADDGGSGDDVFALIEDVRARVAARFGVELATEVRLIGFDPPGPGTPGAGGPGIPGAGGPGR
jgi:UDP-N-acetylmuramate dehydrogenase